MDEDTWTNTFKPVLLAAGQSTEDIDRVYEVYKKISPDEDDADALLLAVRAVKQEQDHREKLAWNARELELHDAKLKLVNLLSFTTLIFLGSGIVYLTKKL